MEYMAGTRLNTRIGTFNCRTLRAKEKLKELVYQFAYHGLGIITLQEHRIVHAETVRQTQAGPGETLITSTAWRNGAGASVGGVGVLMRAEYSKLICEIRAVSHRILAVTLAGNPKLTVISVYSPTECANVEEVEKFHHDLRDFINTVPAHNLVVVAGDLNARIGWEDSGYGWYFHKNTSRNGELLQETVEETRLEITNVRFRKSKERLWTFLSDGTERKATLDYILVRRKWRNSIKDVDTSEALSSIGSDHRLLVARVKVTLRKKKTAPGRPNLDYSALKKDPDLQERFSVDVRNRFAALSLMGCEATEKYGNLIQAVEETSRKILGKKRKRVKDIVAEDFRVKRAREEVEAATTRYHTSPSDDTRSAVNEGKEALTEAYLAVEEEILDSKIKDVERATRNAKTKESWRLIDDISGRKGRQPIQIEGASPEDRKAKWFSHFQSLLGSEPPDDEDLKSHYCSPELISTVGLLLGRNLRRRRIGLKRTRPMVVMQSRPRFLSDAT